MVTSRLATLTFRILTSHGVLLVCIASLAFSCEFPRFMQTDLGKRDWRSGIEDQFNQFTVQIIVSRNIMRTVSTNAEVPSNVKVCLQEMRSKYLVAYEETGQKASQFVCVRFVQRSKDVVQLMSSAVSDKMDIKLCNSMQLNDWLIIDKAHIGREQVASPFRGGFTIRTLDKKQGRGLCDALYGETRMESDCDVGEGITFLFRRQKCVPQDMYMYSTQRTICLASWTEEDYTFMLLSHDFYSYKWILRIPAVLERRFVSYLFKDLIAPTGSDFGNYVNYLRFDMDADQPSMYNDLCFDDYEICSYYKGQCTTGMELQPICPKSCALCDRIKPTVCSFDGRLGGSWYDPIDSDEAGPSVVWNDTAVSIKDTPQQVFECFLLTSSSTKNRKTTEMLVRRFDNGCRPRYKCLRRVASFSSLYLKLSQTLSWPLTASSHPIDCQDDGYEGYKDSERRYQRKEFAFLYSKTVPPSEMCQIPFHAGVYNVTTTDSTMCNINVQLSSDSSHLILAAHDNGCHFEPLPLSFTCLDVVTSTRTDFSKLMVTLSPSNSVKIICWAMSMDETAFYMLESTRCQDIVKRKPFDGSTYKAVKFRRIFDLYPVSQSTNATTRRNTEFTLSPVNFTSYILNRTVLVSSDSVESSSTGSTSSSTSTSSTTTNPIAVTSSSSRLSTVTASDYVVSAVGDGSSDDETSPIVIVGAVLLFAIFQVVYLCCRR